MIAFLILLTYRRTVKLLLLFVILSTDAKFEVEFLIIIIINYILIF